MRSQITTTIRKTVATLLIYSTAFLPIGSSYAAPTTLSDEPSLAGAFVPPNVLLDLSVEFPTGVSAAYNDNAGPIEYTAPGGGASTKMCPGRDDAWGLCYYDEVTYFGYFDPYKCYRYDKTILSSTADGTRGAFVPSGATNANHQCSGRWSGNFLNWATTQTIDSFRWALSGGSRSVDTPTTTILEKARHTGQSAYWLFPEKRIGGPTFKGVTPVHPKTVTPYFSADAGSPFLFLRVFGPDIPLPDPAGSPAGSGGFTMQVSNTKTHPNPATSPDFNDTYYVRVLVCDPSAPSGFGASSGLESNCAKYGSSYKPTGLIQENGQNMRFGAFSYLLTDDRRRAGGVMRSKMKDTAPTKYIPGTGPVANPRMEWSPTNGTMPANPDPADAGASGVSNSGVLNYLNKFGRDNGYKLWDPSGELYYESLKYLRNMSPTPEFTNGMSAFMKDTFPVITNWDDPIQYSCQKNFIIFIGDTNTNCDSLIPGNTLSDTCAGHAGVPSTADPAINITKLDNSVGALEGMGNLGQELFPINEPAWPWPAGFTPFRLGTYHMAGLAYWANTNDIRPDSAKPQTKGKQITKTFVVDVLETGSPGGRNVYWLAAKYGGFNDINDNGIPANRATWDKDTNGVPDNYFGADQPYKLYKALRNIFDAISGIEGAGAGLGISNPNFATVGNSVYQTYYKTNEWTGDVEGGTLTITSTPTFNATFKKSWNSQTLLDTLTSGNGWDTKRKIATRSGGNGVPFRFASLSGALRGALGSSAPAQRDMLDYLRGDRSNEVLSFRPRAHILGDIIHSKAVPVAAPSAEYKEYANPGYAAFQASNASRKPMVYVGANDGMVHAFNAETDLAKDPNGGNEVWAYVPSFAITGPSGTPAVDGLAALATLIKPFQHHYYVDQTPEVRDIDFSKTEGSSGAPNWHSILVGGLGKGGKGYYALDVTAGATAANENAVASKVLWEFSDPDMGFSFGRPVIVKTARYGWVVLLTSGYNNLSGPNAGQGFLYVVNARTGALIRKIGTGAGTAANPSGLGRGTAFVQNFDDFTADQFYVGDLLGNLWRFDLRAANGVYPAPDKIATLTDPSGARQPITIAPRIEIARNNTDRWVFVGTGKDLAITDAADTQQHTMYAIRDGSKTKPLTVAAPLTRSDLKPVANLTTGIPAPDKGWFYDFTGGGAPLGRERMTVDIDANQGVVAFSGNVPDSDPCTLGGTGKTYAVEFDTGLSVLSDGTPNGVRTSIPSGALVGGSLVTVKGKLTIATTDNTGKTTVPPDGLRQPRKQDPATLHWREILE